MATRHAHRSTRAAAKRAVSAVQQGDVRVAARLARRSPSSSLYVADRRGLRCRAIGGDHRGAARPDRRRPRRGATAQGAIRRGDRGLREVAGRRAQPRAGARQRDPRQAQRRGRRARARRWKASSTCKLAEAEKTIAATKTAAMTNVRGIAVDAAAAIVERLIGTRAVRQRGRSRGRRRAEALGGEPMDMIEEPEFWVAVAFVLFVGVLVYVGVHKKVIDALDDRSARIKAELDEARAAARRGAASCWPNTSASSARPSARPQAIIADAKAEAERVAAEARVKMEEFVARRTKMAEAKIAPGRGAGAGRRARRRGRRRRHRRREDPAGYRQGQGRRRPDRPGHRRREGEDRDRALIGRVRGA